MRSLVISTLLVAATSGCGGSSSGSSPDAYTGNMPPPRVIPGGGIGDGAIDGVVNLYVIDDATRSPISGATVRVGGIDGTTDATGLFVATGVAGPQNIAVKATGYRSELWIAANGANCTVDLKAAVDPPIQTANVTGSIGSFDTVPVQSGHRRAAIVSYSQDDKATDAENNIATAANANICDTDAAGTTCNFTVSVRAGHVALIAAILDHDTKGTLTGADDTFALVGWAYRTGLVVQNGVDLTNVTMSIVPDNQLVTVSTALGTPPLSTTAGLVGLDLGGDGLIYLAPAFVSPTTQTVRAPMLSVFSGATYRLVGFSSDGGASGTVPEASVILRNQTSTTLTAPGWLTPPSAVAISRTSASWTPVSGALVQQVEWNSATDHLLSATAFDNSASFTVPDILALPTSGALTAKASALGGTLDPTNFAIDSDLAKVTAFASTPQTIN
jgi:hypothetical protein